MEKRVAVSVTILPIPFLNYGYVKAPSIFMKGAFIYLSILKLFGLLTINFFNRNTIRNQVVINGNVVILDRSWRFYVLMFSDGYSIK